MQKELKNELLKRLPESELSLFHSDLEQVELSVGEALYEPHRRIDYLYFPEDSTISLISITRDGLTVEVGMVGPEGILGASAIFERDRIPYRATVQASGRAHKLRVKALQKVFRQSKHLQDHLFSYFVGVHIQVAQSAICNKFHTVQERLAKWLLLSVDRAGTNTLQYTHEFLSMILGARRTTVSRSLKHLQALGLIETKRASITVLKVRNLEAIACECYEIIRAEFNNSR
jgi:CRP-like cAMP-binding protein